MNLAAEGIPMSKGGQGITEMMGLVIVTWKSAPPGLVTHQGMVALTLVTLPTVQEVTFRDLEALILGGLYLTEVGGALWSMKIH